MEECVPPCLEPEEQAKELRSIGAPSPLSRLGSPSRVGLPLPLWAASAFCGEDGYSELIRPLANGFLQESQSAKAETYQLSNGDFLLAWQRSDEELEEVGEMKPILLTWRLTLRPDFLPRQLETTATVEVEGNTVQQSGLLLYAFQPGDALGASDVYLEPPPVRPGRLGPILAWNPSGKPTR